MVWAGSPFTLSELQPLDHADLEQTFCFHSYVYTYFLIGQSLGLHVLTLARLAALGTAFSYHSLYSFTQHLLVFNDTNPSIPQSSCNQARFRVNMVPQPPLWLSGCLLLSAFFLYFAAATIVAQVLNVTFADGSYLVLDSLLQASRVVVNCPS